MVERAAVGFLLASAPADVSGKSSELRVDYPEAQDEEDVVGQAWSLLHCTASVPLDVIVSTCVAWM